MTRSALLASLAWLALSATAWAQEGASVTAVLPWGAEGEDARDTARRWAAWLDAQEGGPAVVVEDPVGHATSEVGGVRRARVAALAEVERLVVHARREAAALREGAALAALHRALDVVEAHADVPGSAVWLAEVHTHLGIVAAQAGHHDLARASLGTAAGLDPFRGLRAAEAPPALVAQQEAIARAAATRPRGSFTVRADAEGAVVYLDDEPVGQAPVRVRATVGRHVLRVTAPGRLGWGRVIDVLEGARSDLSVRLSPSPRVEGAQALVQAVARRDPAAVTAALADLSGHGPRWEAHLVATGTSPDRASALVCDPRACDAVLRWHHDGDEASVPARVQNPPASGARWVVGEQVWLSAPPPSEARAPWYARWPTWVGAVAVAAAIATAAILLARPSPTTRRQTVLDFSGL